MKKISNPSRTTILEAKVKALEEEVKRLGGNIITAEDDVAGDPGKGGIRYGD